MEKIKSTLDTLIESLNAQGVLQSERIRHAFRRVDRARFLPFEVRDQAYKNIPVPIGFGQTISQPLTVAIMLEALQPKERDHVLDIGAGSGWATALLATIVGLRGRVTGVELIPQLAETAKKNIARENIPNVSIIAGDASRGWLHGAPYDVIHVAAAAPEIIPEFQKQLAVGGRLILPVGEPVQDLALITKTGDNTYTEHRIPGFQFVSLISVPINGQA